MPENQTQSLPKADPAQLLFLDMIKAMATLGNAMTVLGQKIEDMTAAFDDHRSATEELNEIVGEAAGYMGSALRIVDELSEAAGGDDMVKWSTVNEIIKKIKDEAEDGDDGEDEEEEKE